MRSPGIESSEFDIGSSEFGIGASELDIGDSEIGERIRLASPETGRRSSTGAEDSVLGNRANAQESILSNTPFIGFDGAQSCWSVNFRILDFGNFTKPHHRLLFENRTITRSGVGRSIKCLP
jgi:hypothetical protein